MAYFYSWDADQRIAVCLLTGSHNDDADFAELIRSMRALDAEGLVSSVLIVDDGNPPPPPVWRKALSDAAHEAENRRSFVLVSSSFAIRGVLTALHWMQPLSFVTKAVDTLDEAAVELISVLHVTPVLEHLVADVREQARLRGL